MSLTISHSAYRPLGSGEPDDIATSGFRQFSDTEVFTFNLVDGALTSSLDELRSKTSG